MSLVGEHRLAHAALSLGCGIVSVYLTWSVLYLLLNVLKTKALKPRPPPSYVVTFAY
jgi:hypothetical protein